MAELAKEGLYSARAATAAADATTKSVQAWRALVCRVAILFRLLLQILRGTPSWAQLLSSVGLRHPFFSSPSAGYKLLAVAPPTDALPNHSAPASEPLGKLTVVLDLDETLICAYETSSLSSTVRAQAVEAGLKCFDLECASSEQDADGRQKVNHVTVFERPGLREFLKQSSEFADLVLFTAGLEGYARPVIDRIDVDNKLTHRLYRPATVSTKYREHVKDLSSVSQHLSRIVIVDNNPFSFLLQPLNGIPCMPFFAAQPFDDQLMGVILPLLKHLSLHKDVRPILNEKFHMPEWFEQQGIPTKCSTLREVPTVLPSSCYQCT
ncbi:NLI interacting factor-like phosphatase [Musa troglodytarum]|uniref:NLI interacting factor-like phosphatase n=1 Tax=Musa troglodytarum TaxID=320322 RepID=A0A9E7GBW4_9LILI|nr:NLI interacting factor-like phosphatase [Musa troglodytarum]